VLDAASADLDALMRDDEDIAERVEREQAAEMAARQAEVSAAIEDGAASLSGAGLLRGCCGTDGTWVRFFWSGGQAARV